MKELIMIVLVWLANKGIRFKLIEKILGIEIFNF